MSGEASILFDAPGPKARRRHLVIAIAAGAAMVGLLVLFVMGLANPQNNQFTAEKWLPFLQADSWTAYLLPGLLGTVVATGGSWSLTAGALSDGSHTFKVRAIDGSNNVDPTPASYTWVIDTTAPETTVKRTKAAKATRKASMLNLKKPCGSVSSWIRFRPANRALKPR